VINLAGKVALVTGAGPNIGQSIALTLARCGSSVACNDLDAHRMAMLAEQIRSEGGKAVAVAGDITDAAVVDEMLELAEAALGTVDVLVNNAIFVGNFGGILDAQPADWQRTLDVILNGTFNCSRAVARRLIEQKQQGVIVNLGSTSGHRARPGAVAYCTAKGGILNMTRAMAVDLAPHGIRVCSASPTRTGTGPQMGGWVHANADGIPLGRVGEPEDIASAIAFLCSDDARFISGEDLRVDGGALATWGHSVNRAGVTN
jgi:NAD(P)-dependent dehydrogenase (short-subunit alcohol dehydrogenase family)